VTSFKGDAEERTEWDDWLNGERVRTNRIIINKSQRMIITTSCTYSWSALKGVCFLSHHYSRLIFHFRTFFELFLFECWIKEIRTMLPPRNEPTLASLGLGQKINEVWRIQTSYPFLHTGADAIRNRGGQLF